MTQEDVESKVAELSTKYGCKVTPLIFVDFNDTEKKVVGFLKEIPLIAKYRLMDKMSIGQGFSACSDLLEDCLLPESDNKILTVEEYNMGAVMEIQNMVKLATNQFKKK